MERALGGGEGAVDRGDTAHGLEVVAPAAPDPSARNGISVLAEEILPALIARLEASELGELEVRKDGWRVRLRRPVGHGEQAGPPDRVGRGPATRDGRRTAAGSGGSGGAGPGAPGPGAGRGGTSERGAGEQQASATRARHVTSPAVGYYTPVDGIAPGHLVHSGDIVGHVDVLGVRHEVVADAEGVVTRVLVEPGEAVEYGQELLRIELAGRHTDASGRPAGDAPSHRTGRRQGCSGRS